MPSMHHSNPADSKELFLADLSPYLKSIDFADFKNETCSICLATYTASHNPVSINNVCGCTHTFGRPCLTEWLDRANSCPLCRTKLYEQENDEHGTDSDDAFDMNMERMEEIVSAYVQQIDVAQQAIDDSMERVRRDFEALLHLLRGADTLPEGVHEYDSDLSVASLPEREGMLYSASDSPVRLPALLDVPASPSSAVSNSGRTDAHDELSGADESSPLDNNEDSDSW